MTSSFDQSLAMLSQDLAQCAVPAPLAGCRISVIIPCFNASDHIRPCLESLARQTLAASAFEVICVDDYSTDNTITILEEWQKRLQNVRIIKHAANRKQGAARNTGLDAARGDLVVFVDSDDFLRPDALELLLAEADAGSEVVISQLIRVRYDKEYHSKPALRKMPEGNEISALKNTLGWFPVGMLIKANTLTENNIRFREGVYFEDIDFCIKLFFAAKSCKIINDRLYYYVQRDGSTVNSMNEKKLADSVGAMAEIFNLIGNRPNLVEIFSTTANSWLRLQSARIRDSNAEHDVRRALGMFFEVEIRNAGLHKFIGDAATSEMARIASAVPKEPAKIATAGASTSSSPWGGALEPEFVGKVIFFCEVDYHIRSAAPIVRELRKMEIESIIIDASKSTSFSTNRPLHDSEKNFYSDLDIREFNIAVKRPFSTEGAAFVFMNDLTYTKELILENFGFGVPTIGFYEGINDDWNLDRVMPRRPYRSVDYLLLPGIYQKGFYADRDTRVVGLPNVRSRLTAPYAPPTMKRAIINVNFTYGVLEERRDIYVESAVAACAALGLDYVISQHPADKGDLSRYNVGQDSIYAMLEEGTILISRFSTTILEALAMGRPVVYHNPIEERVPKFKTPLGAFSLSDSTETLKRVLERDLKFLDNGGDVRKRAELFLHFHCNTGSSTDPDLLAAGAIAEVVRSTRERFDFKKASQSMCDLSSRKSVGADDLASLAAELLLNPQSGVGILQKNSAVVARALAALPENSPIREHFQRVREFVGPA